MLVKHFKMGFAISLIFLFTYISAQETATTECLVLSTKCEIKKGDKVAVPGLALDAQNRLASMLADKSARRAKLVSLNMHSLKAGRIDMEFFDGFHVLLGKQREETSGWGSYSWCGSAAKAGADESVYSTATITISSDGKRICGSFIYHDDKSYSAYTISPLDEEGNEHVLLERDPVPAGTY